MPAHPTNPAADIRTSGRGGLWFSLALTAVGAAAWAAIFVFPLAGLFGGSGADAAGAGRHSLSGETLLRSAGFATTIGGLAVVLGYVPGRLIGVAARTGRHQALLLFATLAPLLLPGHILYYAWLLLLAPATSMGDYLSSRPDAAQLVGTLTSLFSLTLWHWPVAALVLAQGWRNVDASAIEHAHLDAGPVRRLFLVSLPLLWRPIAIAFGACFTLSLSESATFYLSGARTVGSELALLYDQTCSASLVARAAWPMVLPAALVAVALWRYLPGRGPGGASVAGPAPTADGPDAPSAVDASAVARPRAGAWAVLAALLLLSFVAPTVLFLANLPGLAPIRQFYELHRDKLEWSAWVGGVAGAFALCIAGAAIRLSAPGRSLRGTSAALSRWLGGLMYLTILLAMFMPPALVAVSLLNLASSCHLPRWLVQDWPIVSAGLAMRFSGLALIVLQFARASENRVLAEAAAVDGATPAQAWWHVHLPRLWPLPVGALLLVVMFSMTEVQATMILLPAGVPNFAQSLFNQMHYAREQQVIVSCLMLIGSYAILGAVVTLLLVRPYQRRRLAPAGSAARPLPLVLCMALAASLAGCSKPPPNEPKVLGAFGRTGDGPGEFIYPRAIDICTDGTLWVIDKTSRVQHLRQDGASILTFTMPKQDAGRPTGITIGPDGLVYVPDTHYHRVMIFTQQGELVREFGRFGNEPGCFIYPTDVAFAGGRLFVSEYGGNDRISIYAKDGRFLKSFGASGSEPGQFSRPAAMAVDEARKRLYVADACNHRIAIYDLATCTGETSEECRLLGYIGSPGTEPGQLRYPYGLTLLPTGDLAVCEFGNNRVQVFSPDGRSLKVFGSAGRELGQLAYPWCLAVDGKGRAFVVDSGNNRIQIWQL